MHTERMRHVLGTSVGQRGQITIEKEIREKLGIKPKDIALQAIVDGRLVLTFVPRYEPHMRSVAGILGPPPRVPEGDYDFDEAVETGAAEEWLRKERRAGGEMVEDDD